MATTAIKDEDESEILLAAYIADYEDSYDLSPAERERDAGYDADELTDEQREDAVDGINAYIIEGDDIIGDVPTASADYAPFPMM